jgi:hypothetical protein
MAVASQSGPVLEFLTTTTLPFHEVIDKETRRIVRSHAIRDANRRKRLGTGLEGKVQGGHALAAPAPQSNFTTKFRLDTKSSKRSSKSQSVSSNESSDSQAVKKTPKWRQEALWIVPSAGSFDPFETFPIKLGPKQQALIHYRKSKWFSQILIQLSNSTYRESFIEAKRFRILLQRAIIFSCSS